MPRKSTIDDVTGHNVTKIIVADDHPIVRAGVRNMLLSQPGIEVVAEASDGRQALEEIQKHNPDILLLDLNMPNLPGLETLRELTAQASSTKTIVLTATIEKRQVLEALQLGARGILLKSAVAGDLLECIRTVTGGQFWMQGRPVMNIVQVLKDLMDEMAQPPKKTFGLTARELQVVGLIAQGCTNKDIASDCKISEETVKRHLKNIFDKVGVSSRLELALFALNHHLVDSDTN